MSEELIWVNHGGWITVVMERFGTSGSPAVWDQVAHVKRWIYTETKRESQLICPIIKSSLDTEGNKPYKDSIVVPLYLQSE